MSNIYKSFSFSHCFLAPFPRGSLSNGVYQKYPTSSGFFDDTQGCSIPGVIALTFDDGPDSTIFPQILSILRNKAVAPNKADFPATFFLIGNQIKGLESLVKQADADGHLIENHSWTHPDLTTLSSSEVASELSQTDSAISAALSGKTPAFFRFPFYAFNSQTISQIESLGKIIMHSSLDTKGN